MNEEKIIRDLTGIISDMAGEYVIITHRAVIGRVLQDTHKNAGRIYGLADEIRRAALNRSWKAVSCEEKTASGNLVLRADLEPSRIVFMSSHERAALQSVIDGTIISKHDVKADYDRVFIAAYDDYLGPQAARHPEGQITWFPNMIKRTHWIMTEGYMIALDEGHGFARDITVVLPEDKK